MFEAVEFYLNLGILSNEMNTYRMIRVGGITSPIFFFFHYELWKVNGWNENKIGKTILNYQNTKFNGNYINIKIK